MSQKATRKSQNATVLADEKEKVDTPVKEMKKKIAANAEKDKQAAEKPADKSEPADKNKPAEKTDKNADKPDKNTDKPDKNTDKSDKMADKSDKNADKSDKATEKKADKPEKTTEKKSDKTTDKKVDKSIEKKSEQAEKDESKGDKAKEARAMNGHNGAANGDDTNGTVSDGSDAELVIEEDDSFPELTYDDSDSELEDAPSRSLTRRSQVKVTKTPETPAPRPASERESDDSKETKLLKLSEPVAPSDRKLRSQDSPRPDRKQDAAQEEEKKSKKDLESKKEQEDATKGQKDGKAEEKSDKMDADVVIEVESTEGISAPRTRARVSPFTRTRLDRTATSVMADYTGNNSTMEMDITESSSLVEEGSLNDSGYLRGLRGIRGRTSYKLLHEIKLTNPNAGRPRPPPTAATSRPMGAVVGRKRKPSNDSSLSVEVGEEATDELFSHGKRMKLLDRLSMPFRRTVTRRAAEIVGINTDLPLTAPVASTSFAAFDPETIKPASAPSDPVATPLPPAAPVDRDGKRCTIM